MENRIAHRTVALLIPEAVVLNINMALIIFSFLSAANSITDADFHYRGYSSYTAA